MYPRPYDFLEKALTVLVAHRDHALRQRIGSHLHEFPLFDCVEAASASEAVSRLLAPGPVHCVIQDFGMDDLRGDEYVLVKRFGASVPFIMYAGGKDIHKGCEAVRNGARDALDSGLHPPGSAELLLALCREAVIGVLLPGPHDCLTDTLVESFFALVCSVPDSVDAWSRAMHCCPRQLQRVWKEAYGRHPHDVLSLFHLLRAAMDFWRAGADAGQSGGICRALQEQEQRHRELFFTHHKLFRSMLWAEDRPKTPPTRVKKPMRVCFFEVLSTPGNVFAPDRQKT